MINILKQVRDWTIASVIFLGAVYFSPTLLAGQFEHSQTRLIFLFNLLIGWTIIGWIATLVLVLFTGPIRADHSR